jgi:hypothetical protein
MNPKILLSLALGPARAARRTLAHLTFLLCCLGFCEQLRAYSLHIQLTRTNMQECPYIKVNSHANPDGTTQFQVAVSFYEATLPSDSFTGKLELWDHEKLVASSSVQNARPRAPSKRFETDKKQIPLVFTFTVSKELLPASKFLIEHHDDFHTDTYWFYLREFVDVRS